MMPATPSPPPMLEPLRRDIRHAFRTLAREPGWVVGVAGTLALAIGANAAMFGLVSRLMLDPPPGINGAERIAHVALTTAGGAAASATASTTSYPVFRSLHALGSAFSAVAAVRADTMLAGHSPDVAPIAIVGASPEYFAALGATPLLGRFFLGEEDVPPAGSAVIVLGYSYWQRTLGGDHTVIGRTIVVDEQPFTIIGVARRGFNGDRLASVDAFIPLSTSLRKNGDAWVENRGMNIVSIVARLRDGVSFSAARQIASAAVQDAASRDSQGRPPKVELSSMIPGSDARRSPQSQMALWLLAVSVIVLIIATANVGTLLALRAATRANETAVRVALGARSIDIARPLVVESLLLSVLGGGGGLVLSQWFAGVVRLTLLPSLAASEAALVDRRVLVASLAAAALCGIAAAIAPVRQSQAANLTARLRAGGHGASERLALQNLLITIQAALCTLLVIGAALFIRSLERVQSQDLGFSTDRVLFITLDFHGYVAADERDREYTAAVARVRKLPSVHGATVVAGIPFGPHNIPPVSVPGLAWPPVNVQLPIMYAATPDYLDIMRVAAVSGRRFTTADTRGSPNVVLVNETMARSAWPGQSALGKCVRVGFGAGGMPPDLESNPAESAPCREVVGVVRDSRARSLLPDRDEDHLMQYYVPFDQMPDAPFPDQPRVMGVIVRVSGNAEAAAPAVQRAIQAGTARRLFARVRPYQSLIDPQLRSWRLGATLFSVFGSLALGIAAVGMFGVVSFVATRRTREIGVRLALGGTSRGVLALIVSDAVRMVGAGIGAGVGIALIAGPFVASRLFQTSPREPASIAAAVVVLLATAATAALWPAWRAGRVDPLIALRPE
jgi:putative ABC transport system permease protein